MRLWGAAHPGGGGAHPLPLRDLRGAGGRGREDGDLGQSGAAWRGARDGDDAGHPGPRERRLDALDPHIVPLEEIYRHVGWREWQAIEAEYLPQESRDPRGDHRRGLGKSLLPLTEDRPECMLDIKGRSILERQVDTLRACGVQDIASGAATGRIRSPYPACGTSTTTATRKPARASPVRRRPRADRARALPLLGHPLRALRPRAASPRGGGLRGGDRPRAWVDQRDRLLPLSKPLDLVVTEQAPAAGLRALAAAATTSSSPWARGGPGPRQRRVHRHGALLGARDPGPPARLGRGARGRRRGASTRSDSAEHAAFTDLLQELVARGDACTAWTCTRAGSRWTPSRDYQRAWAEIKK